MTWQELSSLAIAVILLGALVALVGERIAAYRCSARCREWDQDPVAAWEQEHGPVNWASPDHVDPRLLSCVCR